MNDKEKLEIVSDLAFSAREYISEAIMGMREVDSTLRLADSLLMAAIYVKSFPEEMERDRIIIKQKELLNECMSMFEKMYKTNTVNSVFVPLYEEIKEKIEKVVK